MLKTRSPAATVPTMKPSRCASVTVLSGRFWTWPTHVTPPGFGSNRSKTATTSSFGKSSRLTSGSPPAAGTAENAPKSMVTNRERMIDGSGPAGSHASTALQSSSQLGTPAQRASGSTTRHSVCFVHLGTFGGSNSMPPLDTHVVSQSASAQSIASSPSSSLRLLHCSLIGGESQSSPESVTPTPHAGSWQSVLHASGCVSLLPEPSSHSSLTTSASPQIGMHADGRPRQSQPDSTWHSSSQPSPPEPLPSSQSSPPTICPSPQNGMQKEGSSKQSQPAS